MDSMFSYHEYIRLVCASTPHLSRVALGGQTYLLNLNLADDPNMVHRPKKRGLQGKQATPLSNDQDSEDT